MRVVFDPGHGGRDSGATANGLVEKDLNRLLCEEAIHSLPWHVVTGSLARVSDETISHHDRGLRAVDADLAISVHHNASSRPTQHGAEIYLMPGYSEVEYEIAETILSRVPDALRTSRIIVAYDDPRRDDDDWLQRPHNVLVPFKCPRLLLEVGYLTNADDAAIIGSEWGRMACVSAIRAGIAVAARRWG